MIQTVTANNTNLRLLAGDQPVVEQQTTHADSLFRRLPILLQTTLDTRQLLQLFHQQLETLLNHNSLRLQHPSSGAEIKFGKSAHHKCHYQLEIDNQSLGTLSLSRGRRFTRDELQLIEELLCQLVYPLRNCQQYQQALNAAMTDRLTGMANREAFDRHIDREVSLAKRLSLPLSLLVIDIDHFKMINDTYGHSGGDQALILAAKALMNCLRRSDIAFRFGGEEFTVVLSHCERETALQVAERLRQAVSEVICHAGEQSFSFTISVGLAELKNDENVNQLFDRADKALYEAKSSGRNRIVQSEVN